MRIFKYLAACAAMAVFFGIAATPAQAQEPHYVRALTDLRTARDYIMFDHRPGFQGQRDLAVEAINKAMEEIKHAAWGDDRSTRFVPPGGMVDAGFPMHEALKALQIAHHNSEDAVDSPQFPELKHRVIGHIEQAETIVHNIENAEHH
jgi:hypothetical protein